MMRRSLVVSAAVVAAVAAAWGCQAKSPTPAALAGPSELATSIIISITPSSISQDGTTQAQVLVQALDSRNQPISGLPLNLAVASTPSGNDAGQLAARHLVTRGDGRADTFYTAPIRPLSSASVLTAVTLAVTPEGSNAMTTVPRTAVIQITAPGPLASFIASPDWLDGNAPVFYDARGTASLNAIADPSGYMWDFGDGSSKGYGSTITHTFAGCPGGGTPRTFNVTLTVADSASQRSSATRNVTVNSCR